jgi:hypothetical protein
MFTGGKRSHPQPCILQRIVIFAAEPAVKMIPENRDSLISENVFYIEIVLRIFSRRGSPAYAAGTSFVC